MKLQIALDDITREAAKVLLEKIQEDVDIIEIGTPFAYYNDISVIQEFKDLYPKAKILADYKILDGGEFMSALAFRAGADIVTVSVSANNETIAGAIKTARAYGREVLADTMGVPLERIPERHPHRMYPVSGSRLPYHRPLYGLPIPTPRVGAEAPHHDCLFVRVLPHVRVLPCTFATSRRPHGVCRLRGNAAACSLQLCP